MNYEKTNIVQVYVFLTYFTWSRNRYKSQKMGWVNSHITEQVGQNTDKFCSTLEILHDVWECSNSRNMEIFCGKSYRSQAVDFWRNFRFSPHFMENRWEYPSLPLMEMERFFLLIHKNFQNMETVNSHSKEKNGKKQTFQNKDVLKKFVWSRNPIPKRRDEWIPIFQNQNGKTQTIPRFHSTLQI